MPVLLRRRNMTGVGKRLFDWLCSGYNDQSYRRCGLIISYTTLAARQGAAIKRESEWHLDRLVIDVHFKCISA